MILPVRVRLDEVRYWRISTVKLETHYETAIFIIANKSSEVMGTYISEEEAIKGHEYWVQKMNSVITASEFELHVGYPPEDDDLERVNCDTPGIKGHTQCGWNWKRNLPVFMVGPEKGEEHVH